jgi:hypothetical protein
VEKELNNEMSLKPPGVTSKFGRQGGSSWPDVLIQAAWIQLKAIQKIPKIPKIQTTPHHR